MWHCECDSYLTSSIFHLFSATDRRTTPPRLGAVYVLLEGGKPIGTAFAVQCDRMNKLITAGHNIDDTKATLTIARRVEKDNLGRAINCRVWRKRVEVVCVNATEDWAVLRLSSSAQFAVENSIPLCPRSELEHILASDRFWVVYCPVEAFTAVGGIPSLEPNISGKEHPMGISLTRKEIYLPMGLWKGCSGGVVVDSRSRAVAIHLASTNTAETLEEATKKSGGDDKVSEMTSVVNSLTENHASYTTSRLISCCDRLLVALKR